MGPQQEAPHYRDVLDAIQSACQKEYEIRDENDKIKIVFDVDHDALWYKTHKIASPKFGAYATALEKYKAMAAKCKNHMTAQRAQVIAKDILADTETYKRGIDAKSSETRMNKMNRNTCLIDTLANQKSEKVLTFKETAKQTFMEGLRGKNKQDEMDSI